MNDKIQFSILRDKVYSFEKAFTKLNLIKPDSEDEEHQSASIQRFEFTLEIAWKTLKACLEYEGVYDLKTPRDIFKAAAKYDLIGDSKGNIWIEMLMTRNTLGHTYDQKYAQKSFKIISKFYVIEFSKLLSFLKLKYGL